MLVSSMIESEKEIETKKKKKLTDLTGLADRTRRHYKVV
jgi:hypothetical protein